MPQHQQKIPGPGQPADHMQRKNEAEQLTAQAKTEERIFPEPREESTDPNAGLKTEGLSQTSTLKKKGRHEKVISKTDRKLQIRRIKNRTCEAHRNQVDAGKPEENRKRRSEQKHKKEDSEKAQPHQDQTDPGEREERKKRPQRIQARERQPYPQSKDTKLTE